MTDADLQALINAAVDPVTRRGTCVALPPGDVVLTQTVTVPPCLGLYFIGSGTTTRLRWQGPTTPPTAALWLSQCQECVFENFVLHDDTGAADTGIRLATTAGDFGGIVSTTNLFRNVRTEGFKVAYSVVADSGGDSGNDSHTWEHCVCDRYRVTGVVVIGSQAHFLRFTDCGFGAPSPDNTYGIWCQYGSYVHCERCTFNACETAVRLDDFFPGPSSIVRCNGEGCRRLLTTCFGGGHGGPIPVEVAGNRMAFTPQPGDYVIDCNHDGPLVVRGNAFTTTNGVQPLLVMRGGGKRLEHKDNFWSYVGPWPGAWNTTPSGVVLSVEDEGNVYRTE